jgi:hypothetical protein
MLIPQQRRHEAGREADPKQNRKRPQRKLHEVALNPSRAVKNQLRPPKRPNGVAQVPNEVPQKNDFYFVF